MKNAALQVLASSIDTANNCSEHIDQILVLDAGRQMGLGTHAELMTQGGLYRRFIEIREQAEGWRIQQ